MVARAFKLSADAPKQLVSTLLGTLAIVAGVQSAIRLSDGKPAPAWALTYLGVALGTGAGSLVGMKNRQVLEAKMKRDQISFREVNNRLQDHLETLQGELKKSREANLEQYTNQGLKDVEIGRLKRLLKEAEQQQKATIHRFEQESQRADERYLTDKLKAQESYEVQVAELKASHEATVANLETLWADDVMDYQLAHLAVINRRRAAFEAHLAKLTQDHQTAVDNLVAEYDKLIAELRKENEGLWDRIDSLERMLGITQRPKLLAGSDRCHHNCNKLVKYLENKGIIVDAVKASSRDNIDDLWIKPRNDGQLRDILNLDQHLEVEFQLLTRPVLKPDGERGAVKVSMTVARARAQEKIKEGQPVLVFDVAKLENRNNYPFIIITGKQGAGKTQTAQYVGVLGSKAKAYAISPHDKPSDFPGFERKFGAGARYWTELDEVVSWSDIQRHPEQRFSIWQVLNAVLMLVDDRLEDLARGIETFEPLDFYIDESIAIKSFFEQRGPRELKQFWTQFVTKMMTEPRKVGVRTIILTQATTAEALGLKGFAKLRDEQCWLRLGDTALGHAQELNLPQETLDQLKEQQDIWEANEDKTGLSPVAMVDDGLLYLPAIDEMVAYFRSKANPEPLALKRSSSVLEVSEDNPEQTETEPESLENLRARLEASLRVSETPGESLKAQIIALRNQGKTTVTEIMQAIWGLKPSRSKEYKEKSKQVKDILKDLEA